MSGETRSSVHPQSFHKTASKPGERNVLESELWDDSSGVVFYLADPGLPAAVAPNTFHTSSALPVGMSVAGVLDIDLAAQGQWNAAGLQQMSLDILVDGVVHGTSSFRHNMGIDDVAECRPIGDNTVW